jgi:hypothetical protein
MKLDGAVTRKVARSALHIFLSLGERVGVRETIMAHATDIFRGGAGAMIVGRGTVRWTSEAPSTAQTPVGGPRGACPPYEIAPIY